MQNLIKSKIVTHKETISDLSLQIESLENKFLELQPVKKHSAFGLPFAALNFLKCSLCDGKFAIKNAHIENNQIQSGNLTCSCGHHFKIEDGIVMQTHNNTELLHKTEAEYLDHSNSLNNDHIALMKKVGEDIKEKTKAWDHSKGVVFTNADTDILLMSIDDIFKEDGFYIFCSFEIESLKNLKDKLEIQNALGNFIFINYLDYVPLSSNITYLIDNSGCFFDYLFGYKSNYIVKFIDLFSDTSEVIIIDLNTKFMYIPDHLTQVFGREAYFELYRKANFKIISNTKIGIFKGINKVFPKMDMVSDVYMSSHVLKRTLANNSI